ncbi:uncharacterized protein LOC117509946 [Thalassophryne amazonica]|uniref:uncharacterized protein LOC117509946 n=1 Tax=Thalassophryne amazonica TaxID=390379 RepID=UPI0014710639|nr:uncharacterized protein LOC117509946 [Thalassophryne amazonica]
MMSVLFCGWEATYYDEFSRSVALGAAQQPKNRGVYTMYHGTTITNARQIIPNGFKQSVDGRLGKGVYVSRDKAKAEQYPAFCLPTNQVVLLLRVCVGRVKRIEANDPLQKTWHDKGYNTAWMPANNGRLEEDCVFDPDRVEVTGIAKAPNTTIRVELEQLMANNPKKHRRGGGSSTRGVCSACQRKTAHDHRHDQEQCWSCGKNICVLMPKHFCTVQQRHYSVSRMSVSFFGWEVTYDGARSYSVTLGAQQAPKSRGVYTMFHGTTVANARQIIPNRFKPSSDGMLGKGVYVSREKGKAQRYPLKISSSDRVVLELRVYVGRVKRIDQDNHPMQKTWNANGYDTAWVPRNCGMKSVPSGNEENCVFDPKRVEVTGIAQAPDKNIQNELEQLIASRPKISHRGGGGAASGSALCSLCNTYTVPGRTHNIQQCWGCKINICVFMTKHVCTARA